MIEILKPQGLLEIPRLPFNPFERRGYGNDLPYLITTSNLRAEFARLAGLSVLNIDHGAEEKTQQKALYESDSKSTVVLPYRRKDSTSPPLPVELSIDKAMASWEEIKRISKKINESPPSGIVAIDSVWIVEMPNGESFIIQKPKDKIAEEELLRFLYSASVVGARLKSVSGITRINKDNDDINGEKIKYSTYMIKVDLGVLKNPALFLGSLEQRIHNNGNHAGGFSSIDIFAGLIDIVDIDKTIAVEIYNFGENRKSKQVPPNPIDGFILNLSNDSSNREVLTMLSLGIIPQRLNNFASYL